MVTAQTASAASVPKSPTTPSAIDRIGFAAIAARASSALFSPREMKRTPRMKKNAASRRPLVKASPALASIDALFFPSEGSRVTDPPMSACSEPCTSPPTTSRSPPMCDPGSMIIVPPVTFAFPSTRPVG